MAGQSSVRSTLCQDCRQQPVHAQVRDVMREGGTAASAPHTAGLRLMSSGREVMPALGPSWASCVDVRLFLSRPEIRDAPAPANPNLVRQCIIQ